MIDRGEEFENLTSMSSISDYIELGVCYLADEFFHSSGYCLHIGLIEKAAPEMYGPPPECTGKAKGEGQVCANTFRL